MLIPSYPPLPAGPFSQSVSIVVVSLAGVGVLLLLSGLLLTLAACWYRRRHSRNKIKTNSQEKVQYSIPAESYLFASYHGNSEGGGGSNGAMRPRQRRLPLPPEPEIALEGGGGGGEGHYEELDEVAVDVTSGVSRPRLPTFSSDTSETGGTELETVISAATDTQLVTS